MSTKVELDLACPECGESLYTDKLLSTHAWCINEKCKLYIKRAPPYDLMFSKAGESFLP